MERKQSRLLSLRINVLAALMQTTLFLTPAIAAAPSENKSPTLDAVRNRGQLLCGVSSNAPGFSSIDTKGQFKGMDIDVCRAIAAAVLGDANKVKLIPLSSSQRFTALQSGAIDVLARNTTWNLTRETTQGVLFTKPIFYDGQGFLVRKELGIKTLADLNGATICVQSGTTGERTLADTFKTNGWKYKPLVFDTTEPLVSAFSSGRCDAYSTDVNELAQMVAQNKKLEILPELISKEPLAPAVRRGDENWFLTVRWIINSLVEAEELGLNQSNVEAWYKKPPRPDVARFLGKTADMGSGLHLSKSWTYQVVKQVGNYQDIYDRHFGEQSSVKLRRGLNALWKQGGLLYAEPFN